MTLTNGVLSSPLTFKVFFIGLLVLLLIIPMHMIENIIAERGDAYRQVHTEITRVWGKAHTLTGPILTVSRIAATNNYSGALQTVHYQHLPPETLEINGNFKIQLRYRGIYKVPVYRATMTLAGKFDLPTSAGDTLSDESLLQIPFTQVKSLVKLPVLTWNQEPLPLVPVGDRNSPDTVIFQARLAKDKFGKGEFSLVYEVAGSSAFDVQALAAITRLNVSSDWGAPSFQGDYFPTTHDIHAQGFSAHWDINNIFTGTRKTANETLSGEWLKGQDRLGVEFIQPADTYQLVTRSAKYAVLFIGLSFLVYFMVEILAAVNLHAVHYLLIGLANCVFYLLLLSLSEHINFNLAYLSSACCSTLLISLYSKSVLHSAGRALVVCLLLLALYSYLFITLRSEGLALLTGSIGLFVIMALLMFLTRNTDWHRLDLRGQR